MSYAEAIEELAQPKQARAKATYEKIVAAAQSLLDDAGLEGLNSNAVAARADVTVPMFYRYFKNKHALLLVLASRLTQAQSALFRPGIYDTNFETSQEDQIYKLLVDTLKVTEQFTGARALLASLRAVPALAELRIESNRELARIGAHRLRELQPHLSAHESLHRSRLTTELASSVIELLMEDPKLSRRRVLKDTAKALYAIVSA